MRYITFDIETYSPSDSTRIDTEEFRVSVAGAYFNWLDKYIAFMEADVKDLLEIMLKVDLVVGFNHIGFDLPVLQKYVNWDVLQLPNYDILGEIQKQLGFRLKLDDVCKANFQNDVKTDSYEKYKNYHKEGKWFELVDYCMNDVRLTEKVFDKIVRNQKLYYFDLHQKKEMLLERPKPGKMKIKAVANSIF